MNWQRELWRLERNLLMFSISVVLCFAITLLLGGKCSLWQWWIPIALVVGGCAWESRSDWRTGGLQIVLFGGVILGMWLTIGSAWAYGWEDTLEYHFPAIRLLIEGWNPVWQGTPEKLGAAMGVDVKLMRYFHVIAMPKAVWYFNAVAYFFTKDPYNLFYPIFPFLFIPVAIRVFRTMGGSGLITRIAAVCLLFFVTPSVAFIVDLVSALAGIGLCLAMLEYFESKRLNWVEAFCFSFWLCTSKQPAFAGCFIMWVAFAVLTCRDLKWFRRLAVFAGVLAGFVLLACTSPYVSNMMNFGHPLYPAASGDENRYPVHNLVWHFWDNNEDAEAMGHLGRFANAYISPSLTHAYYRWALGKSDFNPYGQTWQRGVPRKNVDSPAYPETRILLLVSSFLILALGRKTLKLSLLLIWLTLFCVPTPMLGYSRYSPWYVGAAIVAYLSVVHFLGCRFGCRIVLLVAGSVLLVIIPKLIVQGAYEFDISYSARKSLRENPPSVLYAHYPVDMLARSDVFSNPDAENGTPFRKTLGNLLLLKKQSLELSQVEIKELPHSGVTPEFFKEYPAWFRDAVFRVSSEDDPRKQSNFYQLEQISERRSRLLKYPLFILESWCVEFPLSVAMRIQALLKKV